uniref:Pectinesterase n=1 Tax=Oryza nivara TaxID=4536 RepID=A0A0E0IN60_ORYNI
MGTSVCCMHVLVVEFSTPDAIVTCLVDGGHEDPMLIGFNMWWREWQLHPLLCNEIIADSISCGIEFSASSLGFPVGLQPAANSGVENLDEKSEKKNGHMAYSITTASQGNMILPSLVKPNSSCDILRSSLKTAVPRYANGTSNRLPSAVYMTQWPLPATDVQHSSFSLAFIVSLFLPSAAILCHFLATHDILHNLCITRQCDPSIACEAELLLRDPEELCEDRRGEERQRDLEPPPIGGVHDAMALHCHRTAAFIGCFGRRPYILKSSQKTTVLRYISGTSNLAPSVVYNTQWPLSATYTVAVLQHPSICVAYQRDPPIFACKAKLLMRHRQELAKDCRAKVRQWHLKPRPVGSVHSAVALTGKRCSAAAIHMTYSITDASHGNVILPSSPAKPNSSRDMVRSSPKSGVPRYGNGTSNRAPSAVYTAQWPLPARDRDAQPAADAVVAADGSGDYTTIAAAVAAAPSKSTKRYVIYIKKGTYNELITIGQNTWNLTLIGDGMDVTIITGNQSVGGGVSSTSKTGTVTVDGIGFVAIDLTIENTAGAENEQAHMTYSITDASHVNVILPSSPAKPNSS